MSIKCSEIISIMEDIAPLYLGYEWDNYGLLIGDENFNINSILVSLDVNEEVLKEAINKGANLIISHHPVIFSPLKSINRNNPKEKLVYDLILNGINVYSAHTNLDCAERGINYFLAQKLNLKDTSFIEKVYEDDKSYGLGRIGNLEKPISLKNLALIVKDILKIDYLNVEGNLDDMVSKVGVLSGSGADFIEKVYGLGCDVYITGDIKYHDACDARSMGLKIIDPGHFASEDIYMENLLFSLENQLFMKGINIKIELSKSNTSPWLKL